MKNKNKGKGGKSGAKPKRSAAQKAATKRMLAANKAAKSAAPAAKPRKAGKRPKTPKTATTQSRRFALPNEQGYRRAATGQRRASGMYKGVPRAPVQRGGYHRDAYKVPSYTTKPRTVRAHNVASYWANPGVPDVLLSMLKGVLGAAVCAGGIFAAGKLLQKVNLTKGKMVLALTGAGVVGGAALSIVDPGLAGAIAVPFFSTAILVQTGQIPPGNAVARAGGQTTATRSMLTQMGELTKLGPRGLRGGGVGELQNRGTRQRLANGGGARIGSVDGFVSRHAFG